MSWAIHMEKSVLSILTYPLALLLVGFKETREFEKVKMMIILDMICQFNMNVIAI